MILKKIFPVILFAWVIFIPIETALASAVFQPEPSLDVRLVQNWPSRSDNWGLDKTAQKAELASSHTKTRTFSEIVGRLINPVLGLLGMVFMVLIIYAGVLWMTAAGNEEKVAKAKKIIYTATVGLVIVTFAYVISELIIFNLLYQQAAQSLGS